MERIQETKSGVLYSLWFIFVTAIFITSLITSNIIACKLVSLWTLVFPASVIVFPVSYIVGDVLTEVYGYSRARLVIWLGFICNLITVVAIWFAQIMPFAHFWTGQAAYEQILGVTPRLLVASFIAYLLGEFANCFVLAKMKILTKGRWLWTRTIGSTVVGQGLDSAVFITIAFLGNVPSQIILSMIVTQWVLKSLYETAATPLTYMVVNFLKEKENSDVYDRQTKFNPLLLFK
jgi:hypothetical protein